MTPTQYEEAIAQHFKRKGYKTITTMSSNDYGVDVFAMNNSEKIAIQAKMYGNGTRKINRQMVMELHGAKDYFDCSKAIIATDGELLKDAIEVAKKLKIEILHFKAKGYSTPTNFKQNSNEFDSIWEKYILPLQGKSLLMNSGKTNKIVNANWSELQRLTSNGKKSKIKIEIFKLAVNKLLKDGYISRDYINQNYVGRASSGVILILSQVPFFQLTNNPKGLKYIK